MNSKQYMQEYKNQQTEEGQQALRVKKDLVRKMEKIGVKKKAGVISQIIDVKAGHVVGYFISE